MSSEFKERPDRPTPSPLYAWAVVALLSGSYSCAFIDRQILNLLAPRIEQDFALSDVQTSFLLGPAFALFFAFSGVAFGRLADRGNRARIISAGIAAWSVLTALCGLAPNFPVLFAARIGVGVGEAALSPSAVSLISDLFPPEKRAAPLATFNLGSNLGTSMAYLLGAAIIPAAPVLLPLVGVRQPWQATFIFVGLPGLLIALLTRLIREPARRERMNVGRPPSRDWSYLRQRFPLYALIISGAALMALQGYAIGAWETSLYTRRFGWTSGTIGLILGLKVLFSAGTATILAGRLAQRLRRAGHLDANLRTMLIGSAIMILPATLAWQMPDPRLVILLSGLQSFGMTFALNLAGATFCDVTPNEKRGLVFSVYMLASVVVGLGAGPPVVAMLSQYVYHGDLANALSTTGLIATPAAFVLLLLSRRPFRRALAEAASWTLETKR